MGGSARSGLIALILATTGCAGPEAQGAGTISLSNGVELPLLSGVTVSADCVLADAGAQDKPEVICLEIPGTLAIPGPGETVQNDYAKLLVQKGFVLEGGASIAYWLRWREADGCSRKLTMATVPKPMPDTQGSFVDGEAYVLAMHFEPPECTVAK